MYGIHSAAVSIAVNARYQRSVVMGLSLPLNGCQIVLRHRRQQIDV
jgi:hypothetical protein